MDARPRKARYSHKTFRLTDEDCDILAWLQKRLGLNAIDVARVSMRDMYARLRAEPTLAGGQ